MSKILQVKHRVHPDYAGRINLPPSAGLFADWTGGEGEWRAERSLSAAVEAEEGEEDAFWRVGVVATSHLLNSNSAAR